MFQLFQSLQVWPSLARTQTRSVPVEALPMNCVFARSAAETGIVTFTPASMPFTEKWPLPVVESQNSYWVGVRSEERRVGKECIARRERLNRTDWLAVAGACW